MLNEQHLQQEFRNTSLHREKIHNLIWHDTDDTGEQICRRTLKDDRKAAGQRKYSLQLSPKICIGTISTKIHSKSNQVAS